MQRQDPDSVQLDSLPEKQRTNSPAAAGEATESERLKKFMAFEVAQEAKQQITTWAKWILGPIVLVMATLGVKTYYDVQHTIQSTLDAEIAKFKKKSDDALKNIDQEVARVQGSVASREREALEFISGAMTAIPPNFARGIVLVLKRSIYDGAHGKTLPGKLVRKEGDPPVKDSDINELYDYIGIVYNFFHDVFGRDNIDGHVATVDATAHYGTRFNNTFWNGNQLVMGDGDGTIFRHMITLDFVANEYSKPVIESFVKLPYEGQGGAPDYPY